jgi:hypothetical protein
MQSIQSSSFYPSDEIQYIPVVFQQPIIRLSLLTDVTELGVDRSVLSLSNYRAKEG